MVRLFQMSHRLVLQIHVSTASAAGKLYGKQMHTRAHAPIHFKEHYAQHSTAAARQYYIIVCARVCVWCIACTRAYYTSNSLLPTGSIEQHTRNTKKKSAVPTDMSVCVRFNAIEFYGHRDKEAYVRVCVCGFRA